jgi:hypothetical protein
MNPLRNRLLLAAALLIALAIVVVALRSVSYSARSGCFGDRATAIEPFQLEPGNGLYLLCFSGEISGEFQGNLRIALEGTPAMNYRLVNLAPIKYFGRSQGGGLNNELLRGLKPGDKLAILVVMQPQLVKVTGIGVPMASCCVPAKISSSSTLGAGDPLPLTLSMIEEASGKPLLQIPIRFARTIDQQQI